MSTTDSTPNEALDGWLANPASQEAAVRVLTAAEKVLVELGILPAPGSETATTKPVLDPNLHPLLHRYLNETRRPAFLQALPDADARMRWAETTYPIIRRTNYGFKELWEHRVQEHPGRTYFQEMEGGEPREWSYEAIYQRLRTIAAVFWSRVQPDAPRVAIISENTLDGACCDLACMAFDILVSPLNPHFNAETLAWILDELRINIVVVETDEIMERMKSVRSMTDHPFQIVLLDPDVDPSGEDVYRLGWAMAQVGRADVDRILEGRQRRAITDLATVMFTSGSTGMPKGVQFSIYSLITKRFARAAALPKVGEDEVLFSFLPLYHTFGRYLEMTGMLFWGGTYVFAGNPSVETLLNGLKTVRPTGLISIPRRWQQVKEACLAEMDAAEDQEGRTKAFRRVVGDRLRWGLSAAGALEPAAFHFFQRHGVELCSGFGMTEATGGITMTPPGAYEDNTVGIPLPGITTRLSEEGELQLKGHYVATYLGDPPPHPDADYWLPTGDIFRQKESGYYEIIDRIKDIYKNSRGQTVAPGAIESKLAHVPGISRTFAVGDGKDYNVLLIVPDLEDPVLSDGPTSDKTTEYFQQIVSTANNDLAPYERVVNFAVLDRDFERERGELTPKGSYHRKTIQENFSEVIDTLYQQNFVELPVVGFRVRIPRWFFRDLGILETEITPLEDGLLNRRAQRFLAIEPHPEGETVQIGDLEYRVQGDVINLGTFARQPLLWLSNPSLVAFCPCKEGWDLPHERVSPQVAIPWREEGEYAPKATVTPTAMRDAALIEANRLTTTALFSPTKDALEAVQYLEIMLETTSRRLTGAIHRRLEALARHPSLEVRCLAYKIFLLKGPMPDYSREMASFLLSGLPFLSEDSIKDIVGAKIERVRLAALRQRLQKYRNQLPWPATPATRNQLEGIFALLEGFARHHPEFYIQVRAELVSWVLHDADPELSRTAKEYLNRLVDWFEAYLEETTTDNEPERWDGKIVFQDRITPEEEERLNRALVGTTFLKQSIMLAFEDKGIEVDEIAPNGIWIAQVFSFLTNRVYRMSVNTRKGKHYDLLLATAEDTEESSVMDTTYWMLALGGRVDDRPMVRQFGCFRPDLGAFSMAMINDLTVWERIRELTSESFVEFHPGRRHWHNMFVRGMSAFFSGWLHTDGRMVPGPVSPANVVVPAPDFRSASTILSLADLKPYSGPMSLVRPMLKNFYLPTVSYYPGIRGLLDIAWLFDACVEALGVEKGRDFLEELLECLQTEDVPELGPDWRLAETLDAYLKRLKAEYRPPLPLQNAISRFREWQASNPKATPRAREQEILDLFRLYGLEAFGDLGRYTLYRKTYFARTSEEAQAAFDRLLRKMFANPDIRPTHMVELSDLQAGLAEEADRMVFSRMVFPAGRSPRPVDVKAIGEKERGQVVVTSHVRDRSGDAYTVREPVDPAEIGRLYRLYLESGMPLSLDDPAQYLLAIDAEDRIVGGICYKLLDDTSSHMDGVVISAALRGKGLGGELLEEFALRMKAQGVQAINTHFISRPFLRAHGFVVDEEWGGLVRFLEEGAE